MPRETYRWLHEWMDGLTDVWMADMYVRTVDTFIGNRTDGMTTQNGCNYRRAPL